MQTFPDSYELSLSESSTLAFDLSAILTKLLTTLVSLFMILSNLLVASEVDA
jgi:hypothetical protein